MNPIEAIKENERRNHQRWNDLGDALENTPEEWLTSSQLDTIARVIAGQHHDTDQMRVIKNWLTSKALHTPHTTTEARFAAMLLGLITRVCR